MTRPVYLRVAAAGFVAVIGCGQAVPHVAPSAPAPAGSASPASGDLILRLADSGRTISIQQGRRFVISLDQNSGSTGYQWQEPVIDEPSVVALVAHDTAPPSSGLAGGVGTDTFKFTAESTGQTSISLEYRRSWESGVPPMRTFHIEIVVT